MAVLQMWRLPGLTNNFSSRMAKLFERIENARLRGNHPSRLGSQFYWHVWNWREQPMTEARIESVLSSSCLSSSGKIYRNLRLVFKSIFANNYVKATYCGL